MLEPLHACNLRCKGCGRVREYAATVGQRLSVEQCLAALDECGAPIVSVCGGEPLVYPEIERLTGEILARRKHMYLCTNGVLLERKLSGFPRNSRLMLNVHLDGMEATHDAGACREGVFAAAVQGIEAAKQAGFLVYTNTTVYKETDLNEIAVLFQYLTELRVDGMMISPAFGYQTVQDEDPAGAGAMFMTRDEIHRKFQQARKLLSRFRVTASPVYLDFLCGQRELTCAAWANPTYNIAGWRSPCYLMADAHCATYGELIGQTDWSQLGPGGDLRCRHCLVHCGFEPAAVLSGKHFRDLLKMALWQMT